MSIIPGGPGPRPAGRPRPGSELRLPRSMRKYTVPCVDGQAKIGEPVEVDGLTIEIVNFEHESPGHGTETFNGERYAAVLFTRPWSRSSSIEKRAAGPLAAWPGHSIGPLQRRLNKLGPGHVPLGPARPDPAREPPPTVLKTVNSLNDMSISVNDTYENNMSACPVGGGQRAVPPPGDDPGSACCSRVSTTA